MNQTDSRLLRVILEARLALRDALDRRIAIDHVGSVRRVGRNGDHSSSQVRPRIQPGRIHKAGSAESILRHCLRTKGWTRQYKRGELTGQQHLDLLEEVRVYARAWLRHEAETFARHYLGTRDDQGRIQVRAWEWVEGPDNYLIQQAKPGFFSNLGRFFRRVKQFVRESIVAGAMAVLGPAPLTGEELDEAEKQAQRQEQFFDRFHDEIKAKGAPAPRPTPDPTKPLVIDVVPPPMTPGEFVARVEMYGNASWQATINAARNAATKSPEVFDRERRVHKKSEESHRYCKTCIEQSRLGWQPLGTLKEIGDSECMGMCDCYFEWLDHDGKIHVAPYGRHNPKALNIPSGTKEKLPGIAYPIEDPDVKMVPDTGDVVMIAEPPGQTIKAPMADPPRK